MKTGEQFAWYKFCAILPPYKKVHIIKFVQLN
jgi:hypothetical protein